MAPTSMPLVAMNSRWDEIRFSSIISMRIHVALGGTSISSSASVAMANTDSLKKLAR